MWRASAPTTRGAGEKHPCVNVAGNRRLNHALHMAAVSQLRQDCEGQAYYRRKLAEGKTPREALRCLKRRISDAIYRQLLADALSNDKEKTSPEGQMGTTTTTCVTGSTPTAGSSVKPQSGPVTKQPRTALADTA